MTIRIKQRVWFQPVTTSSVVVAGLCLLYIALEGPSNKILVRAAVGGWLLLTVAFTLAVRTYYSEANQRAREPDRGALPRHVRDISLSYILALVFIVVEIWNRAGMNLTWRIPLAVLVGVWGLRGLTSLIDFERRRVFYVAPFVTDLRGAPHDERRG